MIHRDAAAQRVGRAELLVGDDAGSQPEHARLFESIGG